MDFGELTVAAVSTLGQTWVIRSVFSESSNARDEGHGLILWLALVLFTGKLFRNHKKVAHHFDPTAPYPTGLFKDRGLDALFAAILDLLYLVCILTWPLRTARMLQTSLSALDAGGWWGFAAQVLLGPVQVLGLPLGLLMVEPFSRGLLYTEGGVAWTRFLGRSFFRITSALPLR